MARRSLWTALAVALLCAPVAPAHARPARDIAGVVVHPWRMETPTVRERTFADIAATGVRWARVDLRWNGVERYGPVLASGRGDWSTMDAIVQAADRHGVRLLPIVAYTPAWASPHRESWAFPQREAFEEFFAAALRRYPQIPAWEIWNEPNLSVFAKPHPDPAGFVELLRSARETRDRVGSAAKLISGGLAAGGQIDIVAWVDEMARLGALDLVDGLGVHPYSGEEPDDPRAWMMRLEALHRRLAYLGAADLPLWITEYGAPSATAPNVYGPALTEDQQAERLRRAFALATRWPWVEHLSWYEYRDSCVDPVNAECNFGLVRADLSRRPAYDAMREVVAGATTKLRPRLAVRARKRGCARWRVKVRGRLLLPGRTASYASITLRISRRGAPRARVRVAMRHGRFAAHLMLRRGERPTGIDARYRGSRLYEPARAHVAFNAVRRCLPTLQHRRPAGLTRAD